MEKFTISKEELLKLGNQMIHLRDIMAKDHLHTIFSEVPILEYNLIMGIWPMLQSDIDAECPDVYLQQIFENSRLEMNQVSKLVQNLSDKGLVVWERAEKGTYISISSFGREKMRGQQQILLEYFCHVITKIGETRFREVIETLNEVETVMEQAALRQEYRGNASCEE